MTLADTQDTSGWRDELKATLRTRDELGEEMEDEVIEAFLARLQASVDKQVEELVAAAIAGKRRPTVPRTALTIGLSLPLFVLAGVFGGALGIVAIAVLVLVILLTW